MREGDKWRWQKQGRVMEQGREETRCGRGTGSTEWPDVNMLFIFPIVR